MLHPPSPENPSSAPEVAPPYTPPAHSPSPAPADGLVRSQVISTRDIVRVEADILGTQLGDVFKPEHNDLAGLLCGRVLLVDLLDELARVPKRDGEPGGVAVGRVEHALVGPAIQHLSQDGQPESSGSANFHPQLEAGLLIHCTYAAGAEDS